MPLYLHGFEYFSPPPRGRYSNKNTYIIILPYRGDSSNKRFDNSLKDYIVRGRPHGDGGDAQAHRFFHKIGV